MLPSGVGGVPPTTRPAAPPDARRRAARRLATNHGLQQCSVDGGGESRVPRLAAAHRRRPSALGSHRIELVQQVHVTDRAATQSREGLRRCLGTADHEQPTRRLDEEWLEEEELHDRGGEHAEKDERPTVGGAEKGRETRELAAQHPTDRRQQECRAEGAAQVRRCDLSEVHGHDDGRPATRYAGHEAAEEEEGERGGARDGRAVVAPLRARHAVT